MRNSSDAATKLLTVKEYLALELKSKIKHEYIAGEVFAMSPVTKRHSTIPLNISMRLREPARAHSCKIFNNVVVRLADDRYYYPDVVLACDTRDTDEQVVQGPCFVVEVTSPSTRATDLREKAIAYRVVPTIRGYLIAEQKRRRVMTRTSTRSRITSASGCWCRRHGGSGRASATVTLYRTPSRTHRAL